MASGITTLTMNLDFLFNAGNALKGFQTLKKSLTANADASQAFLGAVEGLKKKAELAGGSITYDFKDIYDSILHSTEAGKGLASVLDGKISEGGVKKVNEGFEKFYQTQLKVLSGMQGISDKTAAWAAGQAMDQAMAKSGALIKNLTAEMKELGMDVTPDLAANITALAATNEKAFNKMSSALEKSQELHKQGLSQKQLAQYKQHMDALAEAYAEGGISAEEYTKSLDRLNYRFDVINNKLPDLGRSFSNLFSGTRGGFVSTLAAVSVFDDALSAQRNTVETTHRLALRNTAIFQGQADAAEGFMSTVMDMNKSVRSVAGQTQISMTRASEAMNALASARIPGTINDLENLAVTSVRMGQSFGLAEGQVADMFKTLSLSGGLSPEGINAVSEALIDVQAVWGMTGEEATEAASQVGRVISRMTAMGKISQKNAAIVAKEVGRMTTAFTRAGLSAQDASQMMDRFMDPTKIEDNALLWHSMGMSVSDGLAMMTGDASSMEGMTESLMQTAKNLREEYGQNPLALQAMAEAHGMTIQQVRQLSDELDREATMSDEARKKIEQQATLESQANQARESAAEAIQRLAAFGNVLMQTFIMPLVDLLTPLITGLAKFAQGFNNVMDAMGPLGGIIKGLMGAFLLFTIVTRLKLLELLGPLNVLKGGKGFGGLFNTIKSGAATGIKAIGNFASAAAKKLGKGGPLSKAIGALGEKFAGLSSRMSKGAGGAAGKFGVQDMGKQGPTSQIGAGPQQDQGPSKMMESLQKVPAKQLMQIGAAMLMIAGAVALLAISFKILIEAIQGATTGEIFAALGLMVVMFGMLIGVAYALGPAAATAGAGMLFLGGALLMIAGAVSMIILSFTLLLETIKGMSSGELIAGIVALVVVLGGVVAMIAVLAAMAPLIVVAGSALLYFGGAMLMIGGAVLLVGAGIMLIAMGLKMLLGVVNSVSESFVENAKLMSEGIFAMLPALVLLGIVAIIAAKGIVPLALGLALMLISLTLLGGAFTLLGEGIQQFVDEMIYMGENMFAIIGGFAALAVGLLMLGGVAMLVGPQLLVVGAAFILLGIATVIVGAGLNIIGLGLKTISEAITNMVGKVGLMLGVFAALAAGLIMLGLVATAFGLQLLIAAGAVIALGLGLMAVGVGLNIISQAITSLAENSEGMIGIFAALAGGLLMLGGVGLLVGGQLIKVGIGMAAIGAGIMLAGTGLNLIVGAFEKLSEMMGEMIPMAAQFAAAAGIMALGLIALALAAPFAVKALFSMVVLVPILLIMNLALRSIAKSFEKMGNGIELFATNIGTAINGIKNLKEELGGVKGLANDFVNELTAMNLELAKFANTGNMAVTSVQNLAESVKLEPSEEENQISSKMDTVIDRLDVISDNTSVLYDIRDLLAQTRQQNSGWQATNDVNMS